MGFTDAAVSPLARIAGEGGSRSETGEGAARSDADFIRALTLPSLCDGPLPLPQCGRGDSSGPSPRARRAIDA
jgi:hypothetical protein